MIRLPIRIERHVFGREVADALRPAVFGDMEAALRDAAHESAAAVMHRWGASATAVHNWRKALGATRTDNEGTARLTLERSVVD